MKFDSTISKEKIRELPLIVFTGNIHVIDSEDKISDAIENLNKETLLGFDTETRPVFSKGIKHKIALVQLSTCTDTYLFRINKIGLPQALISIFENPRILKIGADINMDIKGLKHIIPFNHRSFKDIQTLAKAYKIENLSLRNLTAIILKQRLSKRQQLSNWEKDELSTGQLHYAATDAYVCIKMYNVLTRPNND